MPVRIHHIHKHHQPGDLASFSDTETATIVRGGLGLVEDPRTDVERALFEEQKTLPPRPVPGRVAEIAAPPPGTETPAGTTSASTTPAPQVAREPAPAAAAAPVAKETPKPAAPAAQSPKEPPKELPR